MCSKGRPAGGRRLSAAAVRMIKPGVTEFEIAEAIEGYARERGAEQHFTLIGSGKFVLGDTESMPLPYSPSFRRIEPGDSVVMEISPCYEGYWTQIARTVNVGRRNTDLEKLQAACRHRNRKRDSNAEAGQHDQGRRHGD